MKYLGAVIAIAVVACSPQVEPIESPEPVPPSVHQIAAIIGADDGSAYGIIPRGGAYHLADGKATALDAVGPFIEPERGSGGVFLVGRERVYFVRDGVTHLLPIRGIVLQIVDLGRESYLLIAAGGDWQRREIWHHDGTRAVKLSEAVGVPPPAGDGDLRNIHIERLMDDYE